MAPAVRPHHVAHAPLRQLPRRLLEALVHVPGLQHAEVAALLGAGAVAVLARERGEPRVYLRRALQRLHLEAQAAQRLLRLIHCPRLDILAVGIAPRRQASRLLVLHQDVARAIRGASNGRSCRRRRCRRRRRRHNRRSSSSRRRARSITHVSLQL